MTAAAVVTGAASGIGSACAARLAEELPVVAVDRDRAGLAAPGFAPLRTVAADVTVEADVERVAAAVEDLRVRVVVSCAGLDDGPCALESLSLERWNRTLEVNLTSHFLVLRALAGRLEPGCGIVLVSSIAALVGATGKTAYAAAKAGLLGLARALAVEKAGEGIRVNVVCPGLVDTPMLRASFPDGVPADVMANVPLGRVATASEIAELVAFLCLPSAAYVTGAVFTADGGWTAR